MVALSPAVLRKRQQEFDEATSRFEVDELQKRWDDEDDAAARGETAQSRELAELRRRVRQLEARDAMSVRAVGEVIAKREKALEERLLQALEERGHMAYRGVFDHERAYARGDVVTSGGSSWIATGPVAPGEKPSRAAAWRMMSKSGASGVSIA